jgi:hypothetical protein
MVTVYLSPSMTRGHVSESAAMTVDAAVITAAEINMLINVLRFIFASSAVTSKPSRSDGDALWKPAPYHSAATRRGEISGLECIDREGREELI